MSCSVIDSNEFDDVTPVYCSFDDFESAYNECLSQAQVIGISDCRCLTTSIDEMQVWCQGSFQVGVPGNRYEYHFEFVPEIPSAAQAVEIATVNLMFGLGVLCGIVATLIFSRG